jgi:cytochrome c oxidase accessory protein FixG
MRVQTAALPTGQLYASAEKIYPQAVSGRFRNIKWVLLIVTLGIYYGLPFLRWDRGPHAPSQAVLIDLPGRRAYLFFIEIWPQEVYYITGLLVLAAMTLFLMNAIAGRLWCGYLCPQTVWTDLFLLIERWAEGDRRERMARDAAPWNAETVLRKGAKHTAWLLVAWWTGGAWVLYFADAPTLVRQLAYGTAPFTAYASIALLTFTTYALAGHMREQVCLYMCPWPRIQAALTDEHALTVSYRRDLGEPRIALKRSRQAEAAGLPAGGCVDCRQCITACPSGIDIRDGLQLSCIQCGLCADACDTVMHKIGRPIGLIGYDTDINMTRRAQGLAPIYRIVRPRTVLYAAIIAIVGSVMLYSLAMRTVFGLDVIHDRNPLFVQLSAGGVHNGYTLRILNKRPLETTFRLSVEGLPAGAKIDTLESKVRPDGEALVTVPPDATRELRVIVMVPPHAPLGTRTPIVFRIVDPVSQQGGATKDFFDMPPTNATATLEGAQRGNSP